MTPGDGSAAAVPSEPRREHELKVWPAYFDAVLDGRKPFEVRRDDRAFEEGDVLVLREWEKRAGRYTGRSVRRCVTYVLDGGGFGIEDEYVVMGLAVEEVGPVSEAQVEAAARALYENWDEGAAPGRYSWEQLSEERYRDHFRKQARAVLSAAREVKSDGD